MKKIITKNNYLSGNVTDVFLPVNSVCKGGWLAKSMVLLLLILCASTKIFAQVPAPTDNSFESAGAVTNSLQYWTVDPSSSDGTGTTSTNPRTGLYSYSYTTSRTRSNKNYNALASVSTINASGSNYIHVIGWAKASSSNANFYLGAYYSSGNSGVSSAANLTTSYAPYYYTYRNSSSNPRAFEVLIDVSSSNGSPVTGYVDDIVSYADGSSLPDLLIPGTALGFTNGTIGNSSVSFTWTNGTDAAATGSSSSTGVQGTVILRTTNTSAAAPTLNSQGLYSTTGGTSGPNKDATGNWTIISITSGASNGSAGSYTDNTVSGCTTYKYAVINYDLAYNYSAALVSNTITTTAPTITLGSNPSVCYSTSATTAQLSYSATTGSPTQYSIAWGSTAQGANFQAVNYATLPATPINIAVPAGAPANTYTGTLNCFE